MTAATGLKRLAIAIAAVIAAVVVTLVALSFLIPAASVRDAVAKEIHAVTGLDPIMRGDMSVSLFPSGTVTLSQRGARRRRAAANPAVIADELTAHLRYFPLLAGRIEIADVTLVRPTITVTFLPSGQSNWSGLIQSLARALQPDPGRTASFSEIGIQDGTVVVHKRYATERTSSTGSTASSSSSPGRRYRAASAPTAGSFGMTSRSRRASRSAISLPHSVANTRASRSGSPARR